MRVRIIKLLTALIVIVNSSFAQTSGYLGKKTFIGVSGGLSSNYSEVFGEFERVNFKGEKIDNYISFTPNYGIHIKRVITNNSTLDFSYSIGRFGIFGANGLSEGILYSDLTNGNVFQYQRSKNNIFTLALTETDATSPIGKYASVGTSLLMAKMEAVDINNNVYRLKDYYDLSLYFSGGLRKVYYDKLLLDFGIDINLYYISLFKNILNKHTGSASDIMTYQKIPLMIFYNNIVSCKVGASYLF